MRDRITISSRSQSLTGEGSDKLPNVKDSHLWDTLK